MSTSTTLCRTSLSSFKCSLRTTPPTLSAVPLTPWYSNLIPHTHGGIALSFLPSLSFGHFNNQIHAPGLRVASRCYASAHGATSIEAIDYKDEALSTNSIIEPPEDQSKDTVERVLTNTDDVARLMKMERKTDQNDGRAEPNSSTLWFPYLDRFKCYNTYLSSSEILEAVSPCISDVRKERFRNVVQNRSYSICLVVEGLRDFGNVSAAFRSADALGFQSVHVVSCDSSKRCKDN